MADMDRRRILVVDDEERMVRFIRMNLEHDGFQVGEAFNGKQAIQKIRDFTPDLIQEPPYRANDLSQQSRVPRSSATACPQGEHVRWTCSFRRLLSCVPHRSNSRPRQGAGVSGSPELGIAHIETSGFRHFQCRPFS